VVAAAIFVYNPFGQNPAGQAYALYQASGKASGFVEMPGDFVFVGNDGRNYTLMAAVQNLTSCSETDSGLDSTKAGAMFFSPPIYNGTAYIGNATDSCLSNMLLLEAACGKNVMARNAGVISAMGYNNIVSKTGFLFAISSGTTQFRLFKPSIVSRWGTCSNGKITWSSPQTNQTQPPTNQTSNYTANINVSSSPLGAAVYYRNMTVTSLNYAGLTPVTISVPNGTYYLNVTYNATSYNVSLVTLVAGQNITRSYNFTGNQSGNQT